MEYKLTSQGVHDVVYECLFAEEELTDGQPPPDSVTVEAISRTFVFHPGRIKEHIPHIRDMIAELPPEFLQGNGGGWSFVNLCNDKHGNHWGEHPVMEALVALAIAADLGHFCAPRDMWPMLPAGLPYVAFKGA